MEEIMMDRLSLASSQDGGAMDDHRNSHAGSDSASSQYGGAVDDHRNSFADNDSASSQDGGSNSYADNDSTSSVSASNNAVNAPGSSSTSSTSCWCRHLKLIALISLIVAALIGVIVVLVLVVPVWTKQDVDTGEWGEWGLWSNCSAVCNGGHQHRNRSCVSDGFNCEGDKDENRTCSLEPCPDTGEWGEWGLWSNCSAVCNGGYQHRSRSCVSDGFNCEGDKDENRTCSLEPCPDTGEWGEWGLWSNCSAVCNGGHQHRNRSCVSDGFNCEGDKDENRTCSLEHCPDTGEWGEWGLWSNCSAVCNGGHQHRNRSCVSDGFNCEGDKDENRTCSLEPCPVAGGWRNWSPWSSCSNPCRLKTRYRSCDNPRPAFGGDDCLGVAEESNRCNVQLCPGDCSDFITGYHTSGVYTIYPWANLTRSKQVYCEITADGPWTVIQRRVDGSVNFYRNWADYKAGFGDTSGEYWLGNDAIHAITTRGNYKLRIRLMDWDNVIQFANYSMFCIADESDGYRLRIGGYSGDAEFVGKYNTNIRLLIVVYRLNPYVDDM